MTDPQNEFSGEAAGEGVESTPSPAATPVEEEATDVGAAELEALIAERKVFCRSSVYRCSSVTPISPRIQASPIRWFSGAAMAATNCCKPCFISVWVSKPRNASLRCSLTRSSIDASSEGSSRVPATASLGDSSNFVSSSVDESINLPGRNP